MRKKEHEKYETKISHLKKKIYLILKWKMLYKTMNSL